MKCKLMFVGLLLIICNLVRSQETEVPDHFRYKNALKLSPIDFGRSYFEISYERYFEDRKHSLIIAPTFMLKENSYQSFSGFQLMLNYRFQLTHLKKEEHYTLGFHNIGFYAGPYVAGTVYDEDFRFGYYDQAGQNYIEGMYNKDVSAIETGLLIGVQFDITPRILLDLFAGGGIRYAKDSNNLPDAFKDQYYRGEGVFDIEYTGVKPKLGLQIGFTF